MKNIPMLWLAVGALGVWWFFMREKKPVLEIGFGDVRFNTQVENAQMAANLTRAANEAMPNRRIIR